MIFLFFACSQPNENDKHTISIESTPPEAAVFIEGDEICTTPCVTKLAKGNVDIELKKEGFESWKSRFFIPATPKILAKLQPQKIEITIDVPSPPPQILVNDTEISLPQAKLPIGENIFVVDDPCYEKTKIRKVLAEKTARISLSIEPIRMDRTIHIINHQGKELHTVKQENTPICQQIFKWNGQEFFIPTKDRTKKEITLAVFPQADKQKQYTAYLIPAGKVRLGSAPDTEHHVDNETDHSVEISAPFYMMETEISQAFYQSLSHQNPSEKEFEGSSLRKAEYPVQNISWFQAVQFANQLSKKEGREPCYVISKDKVEWPKATNCKGWRLPTEAEWSRAAQGNQQHAIYSGTNKSNEACQYANVADISAQHFNWDWEAFPCDDQFDTVAPVSAFQPNSFGIKNLTGNVMEWVWDWFGDYDLSQTIDPLGPQQGTDRAIRGGCWANSPKKSRIAFREFYTPNDFGNTLGFRLVRTAKPAIPQ